ncbi:hypothetical protein HOY80DRAFT_906499, partial [Tuber brumale]
MANPGISSTTPPETLPTIEPLPGSTHQLSLTSSPLPALSWETINKKNDFYDLQDLLDLSHGLTSEKLKDRKEDDVVIFDYLLDPCYLHGGPLVDEEGPSARSSSTDDDLFFRVPKNMLMESDQFDQIINSTEGPLLTMSRGSRLGIIDFPQCYDTYDCGLLNSIAGKLGLQKEGEAAFMDAHLRRVQALPGRERFRTGISLRVPFNKPPELPRSGLPEDRSTLFISVPYLGKHTGRIPLGPESESVRLLDFKQLGANVPYHTVEASEGERDDIGEILVHQARYMIFDNNTMATFRSKEDSANDQAPLHRFQERIGAFRAVIHMITNRMDLELWTLEKLQASLCKLEEDIDKVILDVTTCNDNPGMGGDPDDGQLPTRVGLTDWVRERTRREGRKKKRVRVLLTSLNRISVALFAAISVTERQIVILQDIHDLFLTSCPTKVGDYEKRYRSWQNPFHKTSAPIPILSENPEQIFPATLDAIGGVIGGRRSSLQKIKQLVENIDIRRKMLFGFLGPDPEYVVIGADDTAKNKSVPDAQMNAYVSVIAALYVPLSFWTSYFGMNVKELTEGSKTLHNFWRAAGPSTGLSM